MEDSPLVDPTLRIYRRLREAGHENVGTVLQAYLYRSEAGPRVAAAAPAEPADRQGRLPRAGRDRLPEEVGRGRRLRPPRRALGRGGRLHRGRDPRRAADRACARPRGAARTGSSSRCSTASGRSSSSSSCARGRRVLVATPYGPDWYPYLMRRLAERPANVLFFVRSALRALIVPDQRFAEPGVAFVHRSGRLSACAYRLPGPASTYSRPVLGASGTLRPAGGGRARGRLAEVLANWARRTGRRRAGAAVRESPRCAAPPFSSPLVLRRDACSSLAGCGGSVGVLGGQDPVLSGEGGRRRRPPCPQDDFVASTRGGGVVHAPRFRDNQVDRLVRARPQRRRGDRPRLPALPRQEHRPRGRPQGAERTRSCSGPPIRPTRTSRRLRVA